MTRTARFLSRVDAVVLRAFHPPRIRPARTRRARRPEASNHVSADVPDTINTISQLLATERERTRYLDDPIMTLRNTERLRHHLVACLDELQTESPRAVRTLRRRGWSFARIAGETGLSHRRVAELARASHGSDVVADGCR